MRRIALVTLIGLLAALLLAASPAAAARPETKGGKASAALAVHQNGSVTSSLAAGSGHDLIGSDLGANKTVYVGLQGYFGMTAITTDGAGAFSLPQVAPSLTGTYTYIAMAYRHNTWEIVASVTFTVT